MPSDIKQPKEEKEIPVVPQECRNKSPKIDVIKLIKIIGAVPLLIITLLFSLLISQKIESRFFRKEVPDLRESQNISPSVPTNEPQEMLLRQPTIEYVTFPTTTPISLSFYPDFSKEPVKERAVFDISKWQVYRNEELSFQFKYPPEWGKPNTSLEFNYLPNADNKTWNYNLTFPKSNFNVNGSSYYNSKTDDFTCKGWSGEIFCQENNNGTHLLYFPNEICPTESGAPGYPTDSGYFRELYFKLNGSKIRRLTFSSNIIEPNSTYIKYLSPDYICNTNIKKIIDSAILSRKFDEKTIYNLDITEKVYETTETF